MVSLPLQPHHIPETSLSYRKEEIVEEVPRSDWEIDDELPTDNRSVSTLTPPALPVRSYKELIYF